MGVRTSVTRVGGSRPSHEVEGRGFTVSVTKTGGKAGKHRHPRRRRRGAVAAVGALLLVPAVAAGEPVDWAGPRDTGGIALAGNAGGGLIGLADPSGRGADGAEPENKQLGADVLAMAGNPGLLAYGAGPAVSVPGGPLGIPGTMLQAYLRAAQTLAATTPGCKLDWPLLASIGRIESNHARGGRVDATGRTAAPILGPVLNGGGFAAISDTDGGKYDGDARWDRAVGPMQFIPSTWKGYASDGNGDGQTDPNNVYDATVGAGKYLCSGGMDLSNPQQRATAVFRYNHSDSYVRTVLVWADSYAKGVTPVPTTPVAQAEQLALPSPVVPKQPPAPAPGRPATTPPGTTPPAGTSGTASATTTASSSTTTTTASSGTTTTTGTPTTTTTPTCSTTSPTTTTTTTTPAPTTTTTGATPDPCAPAATTTEAAPATPTGSAGSGALPTP